MRFEKYSTLGFGGRNEIRLDLAASMDIHATVHIEHTSRYSIIRNTSKIIYPLHFLKRCRIIVRTLLKFKKY